MPAAPSGGTAPVGAGSVPARPPLAPCSPHTAVGPCLPLGPCSGSARWRLAASGTLWDTRLRGESWGHHVLARARGTGQGCPHLLKLRPSSRKSSPRSQLPPAGQGEPSGCGGGEQAPRPYGASGGPRGRWGCRCFQATSGSSQWGTHTPPGAFRSGHTARLCCSARPLHAHTRHAHPRGHAHRTGLLPARCCHGHARSAVRQTHGTPARLCTHRAPHGGASPCVVCARASLQRAPWLAQPRWHSCPVQWPCRWVQGYEAARTRARREPDTDPLREVRQGQGSPLAVLRGAVCRASHPTAPLPPSLRVWVSGSSWRGGRDRRHVVNTANCR